MDPLPRRPAQPRCAALTQWDVTQALERRRVEPGLIAAVQRRFGEQDALQYEYAKGSPPMAAALTTLSLLRQLQRRPVRVP